jgi:hypothetical protein
MGAGLDHHRSRQQSWRRQDDTGPQPTSAQNHVIQIDHSARELGAKAEKALSADQTPIAQPQIWPRYQPWRAAILH